MIIGTYEECSIETTVDGKSLMVFGMREYGLKVIRDAVDAMIKGRRR